jgi:hypothetical protein
MPAFILEKIALGQRHQRDRYANGNRILAAPKSV